LNQVLGNNKKNTKKLNKVGINNYDELAKLDPKKKNRRTKRRGKDQNNKTSKITNRG